MSSEKKECSRFFRERKGFQRAFDAMREKWLRNGRAAGKIRLTNAGDEERRELGSFFGKSFWDSEILFTPAEFEKALGQTKYAAVSLRELLEEYYGEPMLSRREQKEQEEERLQGFWKEEKSWCSTHASAEISAWIDEMTAAKASSYQYISSLFRRDPEDAREALRAICRAWKILEELGDEEIQLAVLAAQISGNPHYLDHTERAAQMLRYMICHRTGRELPRTAEEVEQLYEQVGIVTDQISSTVIVYGLHMEKKGKTYAPLEETNSLGEPMILSLVNLKDAERIYGEAAQILVVENEMVFSHLLPEALKYRQPILCTSGQLSRAAQKVLRMLAREGVRILYGGDTDPEGLQIADSLWQKYPEQVCFWRMTADDYMDSRSEEKISPERLQKLLRLQNPELKKTAEQIQNYQTAGYQENLIAALEKDLLLPVIP